jgi:hypothetical protein
MPTLLHPIYLPADLLGELAKHTGRFWSGPENDICRAARHATITRMPGDDSRQPRRPSRAGSGRATGGEHAPANP